jgi:hypothetical protein
MNYPKIYNEIIENAKFENHLKYKGVYYENHHIVPKCLGGSNEKDNLVLLTAKEHFICHKLLVKIYPNNKGLSFAYYAMVHFPSKYRKEVLKISSRDYILAKELFAKVQSSRTVWNKGRKGLYKCSKETREKLSILSSGKNNGMHNKTHTDKAKAKISIANSGENNGMRKAVKKDPSFIKGENNHASKSYKIITPENEIIIITGLREFCKKNNLHHSNMVKVANKKQKEHKGYKCERI